MAKSTLESKSVPVGDPTFAELAAKYEKRYSKMLDAMSASK